MADAETLSEQIKSLQEQTSLLVEQQKLLAAQNTLLSNQITLQNTTSTQQSVQNKAVANALKDLIDARSDLAKAEAQAPFAELVGISTALNSLKIDGKEGKLSFAVASDGSIPLRSRAELLAKLEPLAKKISEEFSDQKPGYVLVADADLQTMRQGQILQRRIENTKKALEEASEAAKNKLGTLPQAGRQSGFQAQSVAGALAAVQTVPFVLDTLSNAAKFFRVDRSVTIQNYSTDGLRILLALVEHHSGESFQRTDRFDTDLIKADAALQNDLDSITKLLETAQFNADRLQAEIKAAENNPATAAAAEALSKLNAAIGNSKQLLDTLLPIESFAKAAQSILLATKLKDKSQVRINFSAQVLHLVESRTWRSDSVKAAGDLQIELDVTAPDGKQKAYRVWLVSTDSSELASLKNGGETTIPTKSGNSQ